MKSSKPETKVFDLLVIGGGIAAAMTALAAASPSAGAGVKKTARRAAQTPLSVCLIGPDPGPPGQIATVPMDQGSPPGVGNGHLPADIAAASYSFLNPAAADLLPVLKARLPHLADGSFRGLTIATAREDRRAEFASRAISGYLCDGPKLLKGLLALCRQAGVTVLRTSPAKSPPAKSADRAAEPQPRFFTDDASVHAVWPGGQCQGHLALLTDPETILAGQAEGLGFRPHWLTGRLAPCLGRTFAATPAWLDAAFGNAKVRRMVTVWQLPSLDPGAAELTTPTGHDGYAWIMPKADSVSIGVMAGQTQDWTAVRARHGSGPNHRLDHSTRQPNGRVHPTELLTAVLGELQAINALPRGLGPPLGPVQTWHLPVAGALDVESHVGKRSLAVGLAGGFVSALSGQWLYPVLHAAVVARTVIVKALADRHPQDVLSQFGACWRGTAKLSDYLRSPNTRLAFLLPLVFGNRQIADRFSRAYLFGESF